MGNTLSQQEYIPGSSEASSNNQIQPVLSNNSESSTEGSRRAKNIHPLLNPSNLTAHTSTPTTAMAQGEQQTNLPTNPSSQDVKMSGTGESKVNLTSQPSAMNIDSEEPHPKPPRRRSTLILTDEPEFDKLKPLSNTTNSSSHNSENSNHEVKPASVPVEIQWFQGGQNVFITGSFTGWRKMIKLVKESDEKFSIKLRLPYGTHRFRFIVDNELRFSDYLPTATDQMGNFVNYIEIQTPQVSENNSEQNLDNVKKDSKLGLTQDDDDMGNGYSRFHEEAPLTQQFNYVRDIPAIFTDPTVMEQYYLTLDNNQNNNQNQSWLTPPQLPPHLESVILNNYSNADKSNSSGALPIPNHVVLNHLATTSIKHNTLAVASVVRYKRKYVTQVLYAPLQ